MSFYDNCVVCGYLSDEGGAHPYQGKNYFVCMDCLDNDDVTDDVVNEAIEKKLQKRNGGK